MESHAQKTEREGHEEASPPLHSERTTPGQDSCPPPLLTTTTCNVKKTELVLGGSSKQQRPSETPRHPMTVVTAMEKAAGSGALTSQGRRVIFPSFVKNQHKYYTSKPYQYGRELQSTPNDTHIKKQQSGVNHEYRNHLMPCVAPMERSPASHSTIEVSAVDRKASEDVASSSCIPMNNPPSDDLQKKEHQHPIQLAAPPRGDPPLVLLPTIPTRATCDASSTLSAVPPPTPQSSKPQKPTTIKSILRQVPKYAPTQTLSHLAKKPEESSVPSLVDIKEESDDDDASQSSSDQDAGKVNPVVTFVGPSISFASSNSDLCDDIADTPQTPAVVSPASTEDSGSDDGLGTTEVQAPRQICFDPRVWIREFHRTPDEVAKTWYTNEDMESFKKLALERILRYQSTAPELLATGTGRIIHYQRTTPRWNGPIYSHAALTLDGENDNDVYMKKKVLEKELNRVMIVDPHDMCLHLFSKTMKNALPRNTHVATAASSKEALQLLGQGRRFDLIIVEERLRLFHRQNSASNKGGANASGASSSLLSSGAALIEILSKSPLTSSSLFVGVSAHMDSDKAALQRSGADLCWTKPPPSIDEKLVEELVKKILIKRDRSTLAAELYGA